MKIAGIEAFALNPKAVKEAISKEEAATVKGKLEEVGATVEIK